MGEDRDVPEEVRAFFRQFGEKYGRLGGVARAANLSKAQLSKAGRKAGKASGKNLTPEQRAERARAAAAARWAKQREEKDAVPENE